MPAQAARGSLPGRATFRTRRRPIQVLFNMVVINERTLYEQKERNFSEMARKRIYLPLLATLLMAAQQQANAYNFSPVNQYNLAVTAAVWNPIINYVSKTSRVPLSLKLGRTSADTTSYVLAKEVDFAFTNHLFAPERRRLGWKVFGRRDLPPVRAQIVAMATSNVTSLSALSGSDVAFPGPEALIAYKATYAHLLKDNIPVNVVFAGNMDAAFTQLASGKVAAVGANSQLVEGYARREGKPFKVLWSSAPFNDLALMVSPRVPKEDADSVADAFLHMDETEEGRAILDRASKLIDSPTRFRFVRASEDDYQAYRDFFGTAPLSLH
ncbi:phosphate/phosphite/phosphonate ABC transporter substrate-binding protein [Caballeronia grimmiae]|uniref:phosphate/phosphite/phosphonate ABC transporter substrate-binding protein n=1 Tax=Caballeronia grimmiae TaxID=1071679 RepID=UPI0038BAEB2F